MTESTVITAAFRAATGKSARNRLRRDGFLPAVVYGHNFNSLPLALEAEATEKLFRPGSALVEEYQLCRLTIENSPAQKETMVVVKDIQRHPVTHIIQHIDFFSVRMDEKITAPVHIRIHGKSEGVKLGGVLRHILREIEVKCLPADIPPHIDIDVTPLQIGDSVHVSDLQLADNVQVLSDSQAAIVTIIAPTVQKEAAEEEGSAAEAADAATGTEQSEAG